MRVMLLHHVKGLGRSGDTCDVADGYARNFLFPKHFAVPDTAAVQQEHAAVAAAEQRVAEHALREYQRVAEQLDGHTCTIAARANEAGTLYGSITADAIVNALRTSGFAIASAWVVLEHPIREIGEFHVPLRFPEGLESELVVTIERAV